MKMRNFILLLSLIVIVPVNYILCECPCKSSHKTSGFDEVLFKKSFPLLNYGSNNHDTPRPSPVINDVLFPPESIISREEYLQRLKSKRGTREPYNESNSSVDNILGTCPTTGVVRIPVLLVDFPDKPHTLDESIFENTFNAEVYLDDEAVSVSRYYALQSYGALDLDFDLYGWETLSSYYSDYTPNSTSQFQLIIDAINHFDAQIDYTDYDADNNGRIDGIIIIHAGTNGLYDIPDQTRILKEYYENMVDGKYLGSTAIVSEKLKPSTCSNYQDDYDYPPDCRTTVIINAHEFGHILGLPDLYPIHPDGGGTLAIGVDDWGMGGLCMMSTDRLPLKPINLDVWSRFFLGWIDGEFLGDFGPPFEAFEDTTVIEQVYDLRCINDYPDAVIVSNNACMGDREFFILSNRFVDVCDSDPDPYNLDNGMNYPYCGSDANHAHLGLDIYHIDEQYIEDNYLTNSIMYDPDHNYWDDSLGHPGIVFERKFLTGGEVINPIDFYSADITLGNTRNIFDRYSDLVYFPEPWNFYLGQTTSSSYLGYENTRIYVEALDIGSYTLSTLITWQKEYENCVCINEYMTDNQNGIVDNYGEHEPWIEIYNSLDEPVDFGGCLFIQWEDRNTVYSIEIPSSPTLTTIQPHGYGIFWIDGNPWQGANHLDTEFMDGIIAFTFDDPDTTGWHSPDPPIYVIDEYLHGTDFIDLPTDVAYSRYKDRSEIWEQRDSGTPGATNDLVNVHFNAEPLIGNYPLQVDFHDNSIGTISNWSWDFNNDGVVDSHVQEPQYVYEEAGLYSVRFTVSDDVENYTLIREDYIEVTDINVDDEHQENVVLLGNRPNPFPEETAISFSAPQTSAISVMIYNTRGQRVKTFTDQPFAGGTSSIIWHGDDDFGNPVGSGIYFYELKVDQQIISIDRCLLMR